MQADAWKHDGVVEEISWADTLKHGGSITRPMALREYAVLLHIGDIAALEVTRVEVGLTSFGRVAFACMAFPKQASGVQRYGMKACRRSVLW